MDTLITNDYESSPIKKIKENPSALTSLKEHSVVVADSGKIQEIQKYLPHDATTNPSLILEAAKLPEYNQIVDAAIQKGLADFKKIQAEKNNQPKRQQRKVLKSKSREVGVPEEVAEEPVYSYTTLTQDQRKELLSRIVDQCCVNFGLEILKLVPVLIGYVSTEVDARLSFDKVATIGRAKQIIAMYEEAGIKRDRILIKIATTWEGIEAAKVLKKEKIQCNLTLIFNYYQAIACAQAQVRLISPFVGRILDWFKKNRPDQDYRVEKDPGVQLVTRVWSYFRKYNHDTYVMAASFRTMEEVQYLCGCDRVTIPLSILDQLKDSQGVVFDRRLNEQMVQDFNEEKVIVDEKTFRYQLAVDPMGNEKLAEGIKKFADDIDKLEQIIEQKLLALV